MSAHITQDVETYSAGALLARNGRLGQDDGDPFGTGNYGYDQSEVGPARTPDCTLRVFGLFHVRAVSAS